LSKDTYTVIRTSFSFSCFLSCFYYSIESIDNIIQKLKENDIDYDVYYYGNDCGEQLSCEEMKSRFEDFEYQDEFMHNFINDSGKEDWEVWSCVVELLNPTEIYFEESDD